MNLEKSFDDIYLFMYNHKFLSARGLSKTS